MSGLHICGLVLASLLMIVAATFLSFKALETRRWKHLEGRVAELRVELDHRCGYRPILRGTPVQGTAWEDYLPAIQSVSSGLALPDYHALQCYAVSTGEPRWDVIKLPVQRNLSAIEGMQRGTRRQRLRRVDLGEEGWNGVDVQGTVSRGAVSLGYLGGCRARFLAAEGKSHEAVELLLDVGKFGQDVAANGSIDAYGVSEDITQAAVTGMEYLLIYGRLAAEDWRQMDHELDELDRSSPRLAPLLLDRLEGLGSWMLKRQPIEMLAGIGCVPRDRIVTSDWRHAFSIPLFLVDAFDRSDELLSALKESDRGAACEESALRQRVYADLEGSGNWIFQAFNDPERTPSSRWLRYMSTRIRLLRLAAHYRATGQFLELPDPFGTHLLHRMEGDYLKFWGVGENGTDNGGVAENGLDIVLAIPRQP